MIVTNRDLLILLALARYYILDRRHVQKLCFTRDADGRVARRRLAALADAGYIRRHSSLVASSHDAVPAPVYLLTAAGCQYLTEKTGDGQYLYKTVQLPHPLHLRHHLAVSEIHVVLDAAIAAQTAVTLDTWYNETDIINAGEPDPIYHYRLVTRFDGEPVITYSPDAAFLLKYNGRQSAYYLELERGNGHRGTGARQLADRKCPGYAEVARQKIYLKHFPGIEGFRVLLIAPYPRRRDAIRRAFAEKDSALSRTDLWRFAALTEITPDTLFENPICYRCDDGPAERLQDQ